MLYLQRPDQFHQCSQHKYELQGPCFWAMLILSTRFEALACFSWLFVLVELTLRSIAALCCFLLQAVHFFFEPSIYSIFAVMFNTQIFRVDPWLWTQRNSSLCLGKAFVAFFSSFFFFLLHLYGERRRISSCTHLCIFCLARYVLVHLKVIVQRMDDM